jgi:carboxyl-terminal processing protease
MIASAVLAIALAQSATDYREDLKVLAEAVEGYAAYAKADGVDIRQLAETYRPRFAKIPDRDALLRELEAFVGELRDFHATLNTNNLASPRLVPSGTDLVAYWKGRRAFVFDVKAGSVARMAGIQPGDEIIKVGDLPVREAAAAWFGVRKPDAQARCAGLGVGAEQCGGGSVERDAEICDIAERGREAV